jgi:hypothetical protein
MKPGIVRWGLQGCAFSYRSSCATRRARLTAPCRAYLHGFRWFYYRCVLLSQSQTGFVKGNISSVSNPDKKVLGFFEASSVTSKRIYFNYFDFGYEFPLYFFECEKLLYLPTKELKSKIENEKYQIVDWTEDGPIKGYYIYKETCTDCTSIASKIKPNFWED